MASETSNEHEQHSSSPSMSDRPQDEKSSALVAGETLFQGQQSPEAVDPDKPVEDIRARVSTPIVSGVFIKKIQ
jgi:hypothetical protein